MDHSELWEKTLINLRSVTQSVKGGVPVNNLQNDYKALIGKPIPFNDLGYSSLQEFIENIPHVIKLKRSERGVQFAEAVSDPSTSHLTSLISKQKGPSYKKKFKSSGASKKYGFHTQNTTSKLKSTASSSCSSLISRISNDNDQEFNELRLALEKEKETNRTLLSQVTNLQSVIQAHREILIKQEASKKLEPAKNENQHPDKTSSLLMEIKDLKSKLKVEENKNISLSNEITKLTSLMLIEQEKFSAEQKMVQQLQNQLEDLQKKMVLKYSALNGVKWSENLEIQEKAESLNWNDNLLKTNMSKSITSLQAINQNPPISQLEFFNIHKEQCIQVNDLKNQIKQQRDHMTIMRKELKQQRLQIHDLTVQMEKLSSEPPKIEVDMDLAVQMLLKHLEQSPQTRQLVSNACALSDNSITSSRKNHTLVDQENVITRIHDMFPSIGKEQIADILKFYDNDENETISAIMQDEGCEALSYLSEPESLKNKIWRLRNMFPDISKDNIKVVLQFYNDDESKAIDAFLRDGATEALNHVDKIACLKNEKLPQPVQVISEGPCVSIKDSSVTTAKRVKIRKRNKKKSNSGECTSITAADRDSHIKSS